MRHEWTCALPEYTYGKTAYRAVWDPAANWQLAHELGEIREGNFRFFEFRVPDLFPLEGVAARIARSGECFDLLPHRYFSAAGQHITPSVRRWHGVLQVCVPNVAAQFLHGELRVFFSRDKRVVSVPEQPHVGRIGAGENLAQSRRVGEIAVRFDHYCNAARARIRTQ